MVGVGGDIVPILDLSIIREVNPEHVHKLFVILK